MIDYSQLKNYMNAPIGAFMPWVGGTSNDQLPPTWLLCDGRELPAVDYPELANILGEDAGVITLPLFNEHEIKHLSQDLPQNITSGIAESYVAEERNMIPVDEPPINHIFPIELRFSTVPNFSMNANVTEIELNGPFRNEVINTIPRKLGVDHTPSHVHRAENGNQIRSATFSGEYAPVFNPVEVRVSSDGEIGFINSLNSGLDAPRASINNTLPITWHDGRETPEISTMIAMDELNSRNYNDSSTIPPILNNRTIYENLDQTYIIPESTNEVGYIDRRTERPDTFDLDVQTPLVTGQFPVRGKYRNLRNYYSEETDNIDGLAARDNLTYSVTLNHNYDKFSDVNLTGHSHGFYTFEVTRGNFRLQRRMTVDNIENKVYGVTENNLATVNIDTQTPGIVTFIIIKAY